MSNQIQFYQDSKISWTDKTWNPWRGCNKVSAACKHCYMFRYYSNRGINPNLVVKQEGVFDKPLRMDRGSKIFTCSMSDFFHEGADEWRADAWEIIKKTPNHSYLILTKRPERIKENLPEDWSKENYGHVWLGVTVESQKEVHRIHTLGEIPCEVRWVSFEPLLGNIELSQQELEILDWAVIGGESGYKNQVRKTELSWYNSLMFQIMGYGIPLFFKQLGSYYHYEELKLRDWHGQEYCENFPGRYKIRQYPKYLYGEEEINHLKKAI
ncbi:DUF5131 family protein [Leeuwenhoekiella nanhaiensis]|uniref:Phage Gp37/Gp68 family protein n=1 Tax=Leeuwenhoekiella nanhaiensis TaxID=1655491 RepID=A0A2G1VVS7_9FLAO|nr:DUF5131 family protein [Leeuwenhoekiella nanhaiensis]PHQ30887.1 hypothetical protein CJ305_01275 [Leeuwenhoekiella nanhaiensis]